MFNLLFNYISSFSIRGKVEPTQRIGGCSFELEICYLPTINSMTVKKQDNIMATPTKSILKNGLNNATNNQTTPLSRNVTYLKSKNNEDPILPIESTQSFFVGIRRKRLKGDSWCYKKVCEEILALTATELKPALESAV